MLEISAADLISQIQYPMSQVLVEDCTGSTNDVVLDLIGDTYRGPVLSIAREQSRGRGSFGKVWNSPKGGLYFSIAFVPKYIQVSEFTLLPLVSGLALVMAFEQFGVSVYIKWPNDIVVVRDKKAYKLAGILAECRQVNVLDLAVIGVGINVLKQKDIPLDTYALSPISLSEMHMSDKEQSASTLISSYVNHLFDYQAMLVEGRISKEDIISQCNKHLLWKNEEVILIEKNSSANINAKLIGINIDGSMCLSTECGVKHVQSSQVSLRKRE